MGGYGSLLLYFERMDKCKCGCVEFTFHNKFWFHSRIKVIAATLLLILPLTIGSEFFTALSSNLMVLSVILFLTFCFLAKTLFAVVKETLHVITPIGVQFTSTSFIGKESVLFIPWHSVKDFVIVEVIVGQQICFYLAIQTLTNNNEGLIILFKNTRPRLLSLEEMYRVIIGLC